MKRRVLLASTAAAALSPSAVGAQGTARLAWIVSGTAARFGALRAAFLEGMRENGLAEGTDYILDLYFADGDYERFPVLVQAALVRAPSVLLVVTIPAVEAAQRATKTVPIVFMSTNDPVGTGLISSLARPGGNTTGVATMAEEYMPKLVELIREALPEARRLAIMFNPLNISNRPIFETVRRAASAEGLEASAAELETPAGLDGVLAALAAGRPDALLVIPDAMFTQLAGHIATYASTRKIGVFADNTGFVEAGALLGYGPSRLMLFRRTAWYVKRILAGAAPSDLPVEQPTKFDLLVNLRTAKTLGLTIPPSLVARADEVIE